MNAENIQVALVSRPKGWVEENNFQVRNAPVPEPEEGDVLVRTIYLSCDPYLRGLMSAASGYAAQLPLGQPVRARAVGQVVKSRHPGYREGDLVWGFLGWETHSLAKGGAELWPADPALGPISHFISILGMPGLTAYVGMTKICEPKAGETAVVSGAAGAVGQIAGQLAKQAGARVVGSAGSDEKCAYIIEELGFDAAFNYRTVASVGDALADHCSAGIDVYYDNVGGETLDAVLLKVNPHARIASCGMISQYNREEAAGIRNLFAIVGNRVKMQGFVVGDHLAMLSDFQVEMSGWLKDGTVTYRESIVDGIENTPTAFIGMLRGDNIGKRLVKVGDDPTVG